MPGFMADHNVEGHFRILISIFEREPWCEIWADLGITVESFASLGVSDDIGDWDLWIACQLHDVILFTANRNNGDPNSLEAAINRLNTAGSPPVITLAKPIQFAQDRLYAEQVAEQVLEYPFDLDNYRGAGRLFV